MARISANRDKILADLLTELRLHFRRCKGCRGAIKASSYDDVCDWAKMRLIEVAVRWDRNISVRLSARKSCRGYLFPCPDTSLHGKAYALAAEPYLPGGDQARLF